VNRWSGIRKYGLYGGLIVLLLVPMAWLSQPATSKSAGGKLATLRADYKLSQANLGEIDPASATMRLASLGMANIGANLLWERANYYKKTEDWTNFRATLDQIIKLQPNFVAVWRFQAWNLSYNVSAEFDDYKDRYHWVKEGIKYLYRGNEYNADSPRLQWDTGWFISHKIGRSDERQQFRRMFRHDEDLFGDEAKTKDFDNWLEGKRWFQLAHDTVRRINSYKGMNPLIFQADPAMAQINYASNLNEDGVYGERAKQAWQQANDDWFAYGRTILPTTFGFDIALNDKETAQEKAKELRAKLDEMAPGAREQIREEKRASLTPAERTALDIPYEQRTPEQQAIAGPLEDKVRVSHLEVGMRAPEDKRLEALNVADELGRSEEYALGVERYRSVVNFDYWRMRCEMERTDDALRAHTLVNSGKQKRDRADLVGAKADLKEGLELWKKVLGKYPPLIDDRTTGEDLASVLESYREILEQNEEHLPDDEFYQMVLTRYGKQPGDDAHEDHDHGDHEHGAGASPEAPKADEAAKTEAGKTEAAPQAEEAPKAEASPTTVEPAKVEETPKTEEAPKVDEAPKTDEAPKAEEAPKA
jgi:hypothetical protein